MTPDEIRIAIAECCGWRCKFFALYVAGGENAYVWLNPNGVADVLPNYSASLDACAEFEKTLTTREQPTYILFLCGPGGMTPSSYWENRAHEAFYLATATPTQRCEAFLRTKGKWKE